MSVLVDTSVWIRFLSNRAPFASELERLLDSNEVAGHAFVYGELLISDAAGRRELLTAYPLIEQVPTVPHHEVVDFVRARRLYGHGIGWVDAHLLASALVSGVRLMTADKALAAVADALGIGYRGVQ